MLPEKRKEDLVERGEERSVGHTVTVDTGRSLWVGKSNMSSSDSRRKSALYTKS